MICASHDYAEGGLAGPTIPEEYQGQSTTKAIWISRHVLLGCNTVVLPGIHLPEGMATGAMTLVTNQRYEPWTLYVGIPARPLRSRNKDKILEQANRLLADYS
jgi:galactoside O-acetyltransferase